MRSVGVNHCGNLLPTLGGRHALDRNDTFSSSRNLQRVLEVDVTTTVKIDATASVSDLRVILGHFYNSI